MLKTSKVEEKVSILEAISQLEPQESVSVDFYAGYRGEETPRHLFIKGQRFTIDEVLERKREALAGGPEWADVFVCRVGNCRLKLKKILGEGWAVIPLQ